MNMIRFGVELEFKNVHRADIGKAIADVMGWEMKIEMDDEIELTDKQGRVWRIESDTSIADTYYYANELVTPPITIDDLPILLKLVAIIKANKGKVDGSCGMHVHVDGDVLDFKAVHKLIKLFIEQEDKLYSYLDVKANREEKYCKQLKTHPALIDELDQIKDFAELQDVWTYGHNIKYKSRYYGLNAYALWYTGTIEFRMFNGTLDEAEIKENIEIVLELVDEAINGPTADRYWIWAAC